MVKENHRQKTVIMPIALENRLIEHISAKNSTERRFGTPRSQQTTESKVICDALSLFLTTFED